MTTNSNHVAVSTSATSRVVQSSAIENQKPDLWDEAIKTLSAELQAQNVVSSADKLTVLDNALKAAQEKKD